MANTVFTVSDLSKKRTDVLREARSGFARVRDTDGTSLIMLPESRLEFLERMQEVTGLLVVLDHLVSKGGPGAVRDLGTEAWLRVFPVEDLSEFAAELGDALQAARSDGNADLLNEVVEAWRLTARQLDDPLRRDVLLGLNRESDFVEAVRPTDN